MTIAASAMPEALTEVADHHDRLHDLSLPRFHRGFLAARVSKKTCPPPRASPCDETWFVPCGDPALPLRGSGSRESLSRQDPHRGRIETPGNRYIFSHLPHLVGQRAT